MKVKLATQVFSHSVHAALMSAIDIEEMKDDATATALFIKFMNDLFDNLNSRTLFDCNPQRRALSRANKHVEDNLKNAVNIFESLEVCNNGRKNPPCIDGFVLSIKSILSLWADLEEEEDVSFLLTSRLNQDPLENLFAVLRQRSGNNNNPTAMQLRQNLQTVINMKLIVPPLSANCERDADSSLLSAEDISQNSEEETNNNTENLPISCSMDDVIPEETIDGLKEKSLENVTDYYDSEAEPEEEDVSIPYNPYTGANGDDGMLYSCFGEVICHKRFAVAVAGMKGEPSAASKPSACQPLYTCFLDLLPRWQCHLQCGSRNHTRPLDCARMHGRRLDAVFCVCHCTSQPAWCRARRRRHVIFLFR
ncbi:hypothetical protein B566_EDAN015137 [Ephemera danica]|nr:hypothetical protein B566_EDAN015137 [Ephemera danica]